MTIQLQLTPPGQGNRWSSHWKTDDQDISTTGAAGNITIEDGSTLNLNVDDADADATNEYNTGISFDGTDLTITDGGGNQVIDIRV